MISNLQILLKKKKKEFFAEVSNSIKEAKAKLKGP